MTPVAAVMAKSAVPVDVPVVVASSTPVALMPGHAACAAPVNGSSEYVSVSLNVPLGLSASVAVTAGVSGVVRTEDAASVTVTI